MSTKLHLGVVELPYSYEREALNKRTGKPLKRKRKISSSITTGDVATILEARYHIMETFFEVYKQQIADALAKSSAGALESLLMGGPVAIMDPIAEAAATTKELFSKFIEKREMEGMGIPGVPTKAALDGVSHRFAHPYAKRPPRPSFLDTGTYQSAFMAWISE